MDQPGLEDQQSSADQDPVSVTDIESEQVSGPAHDENFEGDDFAEDDDFAKGVEFDDEAESPDSLDATGTGPVASALDIEGLPEPEPQVVRTVEALLFLAPDPLSPQELSDAAATEELEVIAALAELAERYAPGHSGIHLRELGEASLSPAIPRPRMLPDASSTAPVLRS